MSIPYSSETGSTVEIKTKATETQQTRRQRLIEFLLTRTPIVKVFVEEERIHRAYMANPELFDAILKPEAKAPRAALPEMGPTIAVEEQTTLPDFNVVEDDNKAA